MHNFKLYTVVRDSRQDQEATGVDEKETLGYLMYTAQYAQSHLERAEAGFQAVSERVASVE